MDTTARRGSGGGGRHGAVAVSPRLSFAYAYPQLHIVLETAEALIGIFVVYLLVGRLQQRRLRSDAAGARARRVGGNEHCRRSAGSGAQRLGLVERRVGAGVARLLGAAAVAIAAFASPSRIADSRTSSRRSVLAGFARVEVSPREVPLRSRILHGRC